METIKAIMTRRSIKNFTNEALTQKEIETLLKAAMNAPSAFDERPWHFVVTTNEDKLNKLEAVDPVAAGAKATILLCGDPKLEKIEGADFWIQDLACAAQNIQLAAHDMEIGCIWIAVIKVPPRIKACRELLNVPEGIEPLALLCLGKPAENLPAELRYDKSRVHIDEW